MGGAVYIYGQSASAGTFTRVLFKNNYATVSELLSLSCIHVFMHTSVVDCVLILIVYKSFYMFLFSLTFTFTGWWRCSVCPYRFWHIYQLFLERK